MGNVALYHTEDGGEITVDRGEVEQDGGLEAAVYLSLFGNNVHGDWWGDIDEDDPARRYPGETQKLIDGLPARPSNLLRIEDAATRDLQALVDAGVIESVEPSASMDGPKRLKLEITINGDETLRFELNWEKDRGD